MTARVVTSRMSCGAVHSLPRLVRACGGWHDAVTWLGREPAAAPARPGPGGRGGRGGGLAVGAAGVGMPAGLAGPAGAAVAVPSPDRPGVPGVTAPRAHAAAHGSAQAGVRQPMTRFSRTVRHANGRYTTTI